MENYEYMLPYETYTVLKWVALIACPALATFVGIFLPTWGLPYSEQIVTTINAFGLFLGALLGLSATTAKVTEDATQELQIPRHMRDGTDED
jgi:NADH:ubiquinone oxidoreductase subunit 4 (subunit M)